MGMLKDLLLHPEEARAVLQYKLWHDPLNVRKPDKESRELQRCYHFLDMTSRSFSAVIKELNDELRDAVMIFYLVLRGLDTVEDDMTIPLDRKLPLLRDFYNKLEVPGWTFTENGPNEKDRQLLVEFDVVVAEFAKLKPAFRETISDICKEMGEGMAYYSEATRIVDTLKDFDQYCHYVAGLVGEGLSRLFASSGLEDERYAGLMDLSNSMGLFLQKTNIMRDYREDLDDGRIFWPKAIWSKYASDISDLARPENRDKAIHCLSEMTCNALDHATDCLVYLSGLRNQSVFNFCAIPQVMAIATMALCFRNDQVFQRNVKIRKGQACLLIMKSTNLKAVCEIFCDYARQIQRKNTPSDPNYLRISEACGRIEAWSASVFPPPNAQQSRSRAGKSTTGITLRGAARGPDSSAGDSVKIFGAVIVFWTLLGASMLGVAYLFGARFDLAWHELQKNILRQFANRRNASSRVEL